MKSRFDWKLVLVSILAAVLLWALSEGCSAETPQFYMITEDITLEEAGY